MSGSISFSCLRFRSGGFASCCATLSPQNVSTGCTGKGEEAAGRQGRVGVCPRRMGQAPDQHFLGPVTVPEHSRHVCTVCRHKWPTDLGVCFVSPPFVFFCYSGGSSSHLNTGQHRESKHGRTQAGTYVRAHARTQARTQRSGWGRSISALSLLIIFSAGFQSEA